MKKSNTHEWVGFINSYSNTYTLKLRKVDSVTEKPLQNAVFALYGKYEEEPIQAESSVIPNQMVVLLYFTILRMLLQQMQMDIQQFRDCIFLTQKNLIFMCCRKQLFRMAI